MAQVSEQAIELQGEARPAWKLIAALSVRLGKDIGFRRLDAVRSAMTPTATNQGAAAAPAGAAE
jgi:NADH dehydrogenase/NADH:ubiquinone oxidoreductase subunit G